MNDQSHTSNLTNEPQGDLQSNAQLTRRRAVLLAAAAGAVAAFGVDPGQAVLSVDLNQGNVQPIPIALPDFIAGSPSVGESARGISQIITANLRRSGLFSLVDHALSNEIINFDKPRFSGWSAIHAQALVTGRVTGQGGGIKVEFRLWDVFGQFQLAGQEYLSTPDNFRPIDHWNASVEIRSDNDQGASLPVLAAKSRYDSFIEIFRDKFFERRAIRQGVGGEACQQRAPLKNVLLLDRRIDFSQNRIEVGAEKSKWRDQRSRADAGDDLESWTHAALRPPDEQTGAERTVIAASGNREDVFRRDWPTDRSKVSDLAFVQTLSKRTYSGPVTWQESGIRNPEHRCPTGFLGRDRS